MKKDNWIDFQRGLLKIDTHEHIPPEAYAMEAETDIFDVLLVPYNCDTMFSAGCTPAQWAQLMDKAAPFSTRYDIFAQYLPDIQHTAFFRAVKTTLALTFGEAQCTQEALQRADTALKQELRTKHYHKHMEKNGIEAMFCCAGYDLAHAYTDKCVRFIPTVSEILPRNRKDVQRLESASGTTIYDLQSCLHALEKMFAMYEKNDVRAIKFGSGYRRKLDFDLPNFMTAEAQLKHVLNLKIMGDAKHNGSIEPCGSYEELTVLDDYLTDYMLVLCEKHGFCAIFHAAMHAWNENDPQRAHASHLTNCIQRHDKVKFILLHAGAPFFEEAILLARYYSNVYLDLTWFHIISPQLAQSAIVRILELVPVNKIFAFGGDYCSIQALSGHLEMAMQNFATVFAQAEAEGVFTQQEGMTILQAWYYENPKRVFAI